ncbi:MAG: response regulator [Vulcanimicrobiota bacterium]
MKLSFVLVDDEQDVLDILRIQMESEGHRVRTFTSSRQAFQAILNEPPDCVVTDIMIPEMDGVELTRSLREVPALSKLKIVVLSGKIYQTDRERALQAGADGFLPKSQGNPEEVLATLVNLVLSRLSLRFWGCRGTIPVPGPNTVKYGGNTSCVSLTFPNEHIFVFDAGSGIKPLADYLVGSGRSGITGTVFISHPHWDHINFLPFFRPFYIPGNSFTIVGTPVNDLGIEQLVANQMGGVHFPITTREFGAQVHYKDIGEGSYQLGPARVESMLLCHPGNTLGFSVYFKARKICYVTDNEIFPQGHKLHSPSYLARLTEFVKDADILITDATYFDDEYTAKVGWGHSPVSEVIGLAHTGGVKELYLFHHDPDQDDRALERKLAFCQERLSAMNSNTVPRLALAEEELILQG